MASISTTKFVFYINVLIVAYSTAEPFSAYSNKKKHALQVYQIVIILLLKIIKYFKSNFTFVLYVYQVKLNYNPNKS